MSNKYDYDYFVIGGGSGGVRSARIAASHGAKVGLAEGRDLGGTCVNVGCVPKKLFVYAADFSNCSSDSAGYGWDIENKNFCWKTLVQNKTAEITRLNGIYGTMLEKAGVKVHKGFAHFKDNHTLIINDQEITADKILIAVGGKPWIPDFPGNDLVKTSDDMFELKTLPKTMVIQGGGYIAVEFANIMNKLGVDVTVIHRGEQILRGFDDDIRNFLAIEMSKQGIKLDLNDNIEKVEKTENGLTVQLTSGGHYECDMVLSATGRAPDTKRLGLNEIKVGVNDSGSIPINDQFQTNVDNIYAVGDITDNIALTPIAIAEGHILADRLFGKGDVRDADMKKVASAVFSSPSIATIGITELEAVKEGYDIDIFRTSFKPMIYTLTEKDERFMMKLVVDKKTDDVLGIHLCGKDAPEMMQGFAVALQAGAKKADFDRTIGIHPTSAEELVTMREPITD